MYYSAHNLVIYEPNNMYIRLMMYNWEQEDWPNFHYSTSEIEEDLLLFRENQGEIQGMFKVLPDRMQQESMIDVMVAEAMKTSVIEGEMLSREDVLSSIRNSLGLNRFPERIKDKRAAGVARLMVAVRENFVEVLSEDMLFAWHRMMMESYANIRAGHWRTGQEAMQIISGAYGKEIVHYEAPPSATVPPEMQRFITWYNETAPHASQAIVHAPIRAAIAHLYFESIHPFEDGNGRMGRAISEKALSQGSGKPLLLSLSQAIASKRSAYYDALKQAQRSNEISPWLRYFMTTILEAQEYVIQQIRFTIAKVRFFDTFSSQLNSRQEKALNRMFEAGPDGFTGGMRTKKYMSITKTSKATATRDLQYLLEIGALKALGGGRSRYYELQDR